MASLQMNKLPWWGQLLVFTVMGALGIGAWIYLSQGRKDALDVQRGELAAVHARIDKGRETARKLDEFRNEVGQLESRLEGLKAILPQEKDVADLLRRMQTLASQSNLTIRHFRPRAIAVRELHAEWPIEIEVEGAYHNVGQFFDKVSKLPRMINVGAIEMVTTPRPTSGATVTVKCTAVTFVLNEQPTPSGAPPANGTAKKTE